MIAGDDVSTKFVETSSPTFNVGKISAYSVNPPLHYSR